MPGFWAYPRTMCETCDWQVVYMMWAKKIGVRDDVLLKPDTLSPEEFAKIAEHPVIGAEILAPMGLEKVSRYIAVHRENVDGSGYPVGLKAEQIPLPGRIHAVVDTYDALSNERPYHGARSEKEA